MYDLERFCALLRADLVPLVRDQGFEALGDVFCRVKGERIDIVSLRSSRRERCCCVDMGVHYTFLPPSGGVERVDLDRRRLRQHDCAFRTSLSEEGEAEHWWSYGSDDDTALTNATDLVDMFRRRAVLFFGAFEPFPGAFDILTPDQLLHNHAVIVPKCHAEALKALTLARIMAEAGLAERSREFAEFGLLHLGAAIRLRPELERLRG